MAQATAALRATAYHEAGHAIAAYVQHIKIKSVSIKPTPDSHGRLHHESPLRGIRLDIDGSDRACMRAERAIILALAGPEAQRRFAPRSLRRWHTLSDYEGAADLALRLCGDGETATLYLRYLTRVARNLVEAHWPMVEAVARDLLTMKRLDGPAIAEAVNRRRRRLGAINVIPEAD